MMYHVAFQYLYTVHNNQVVIIDASVTSNGYLFFVLGPFNSPSSAILKYLIVDTCYRILEVSSLNRTPVPMNHPFCTLISHLGNLFHCQHID